MTTGKTMALTIGSFVLKVMSLLFNTLSRFKVKVKLLSHVWFFATPWTVGYQVPPSVGFSRQEYWSGVPLPSLKNYSKPRQYIKKQRHHFANKGPSSQSYGFPSSHVWMWELDHKESWALKNWCFWTVVFEKTLESSLDSKELKPVNPKGNQYEYTQEGLMLKIQHFGHLMRKADSLEKTLMARTDWG